MLHTLLHPRKGTVKHLVSLIELLVETMGIVVAMLYLISRAKLLDQATIAFFLAAGVSIYTLVAIVTSLDIMGFSFLLEEDE